MNDEDPAWSAPLLVDLGSVADAAEGISPWTGGDLNQPLAS